MFLFKEGWPYIAIPITIGIAFFIFTKTHGFQAAGVLFLVAGIFFANFFRDPPRKIVTNDNYLLSPCDGTVLEIVKENGENVVRVFLSVFNVHLQRSPCAGKIADIKYVPGKFHVASDPRAHTENENNTFFIINGSSETIKVKQISGILARRIVAWSKIGEEILQGGKIGMIKFGSQVDIYFPETFEVKVRIGEKVKAGLDIIAEKKNNADR